jgi:hypothetical protein
MLLSSHSTLYYIGPAASRYFDDRACGLKGHEVEDDDSQLMIVSGE